MNSHMVRDSEASGHAQALSADGIVAASEELRAMTAIGADRPAFTAVTTEISFGGIEGSDPLRGGPGSGAERGVTE